MRAFFVVVVVVVVLFVCFFACLFFFVVYALSRLLVGSIFIAPFCFTNMSCFPMSELYLHVKNIMGS